MSEYTTFVLPSEMVTFDPANECQPVDPEPLPELPYKGAAYLQELTSAKARMDYFSRAMVSLKCIDFDTIAFTGMSGALFAPTLAFAMHKELIAVRKNGTNDTHSFHSIEGYVNSQRYIIVDDFMCSGSTVQTIRNRVREFSPQAELVGAYMYYDGLFYPASRLYFCL